MTSVLFLLRMCHKSPAKLLRNVRRITKFLEKKPKVSSLSITALPPKNISPVLRCLNLSLPVSIEIPPWSANPAMITDLKPQPWPDYYDDHDLRQHPRLHDDDDCPQPVLHSVHDDYTKNKNTSTDTPIEDEENEEIVMSEFANYCPECDLMFRLEQVMIFREHCMIMHDWLWCKNWYKGNGCEVATTSMEDLKKHMETCDVKIVK